LENRGPQSPHELLAPGLPASCWRWPMAVAAISAVVLGGCAGGRPSETQLLREGGRVFVSARCGACHTVASAHTHGQVGPDFDTSEQLNRDQIRTELDYGDGDGVIPRPPKRPTARCSRRVRLPHAPSATLSSIGCIDRWCSLVGERQLRDLTSAPPPSRPEEGDPMDGETSQDLLRRLSVVARGRLPPGRSDASNCLRRGIGLIG